MGKAADILEGLDYSETAYTTAKMRLQRKFGGPRRQVQNQIEKLRSMKLLHADNVEDLEKFKHNLLAHGGGELDSAGSHSNPTRTLFLRIGFFKNVPCLDQRKWKESQSKCSS